MVGLLYLFYQLRQMIYMGIKNGGKLNEARLIIVSMLL